MALNGIYTDISAALHCAEFCSELVEWPYLFVLAVWVVFPGDICLARSLLFSWPHPIVFLFRRTDWWSDPPKTFDFLTRSENCTALNIRLLNWMNIPVWGLAWAWELMENKIKGFEGIQNRDWWVPHNGKYPQIREGSRALRRWILLLVVGSLVRAWKLLRILPLGISASSTMVSSVANVWHILLSIYYLQELYWVQEVQESMGTVLPSRSSRCG